VAFLTDPIKDPNDVNVKLSVLNTLITGWNVAKIIYCIFAATGLFIAGALAVVFIFDIK
jgi:hypothetical protein